MASLQEGANASKMRVKDPVWIRGSTTLDDYDLDGRESTQMWMKWEEGSEAGRRWG